MRASEEVHVFSMTSYAQKWRRWQPARVVMREAVIVLFLLFIFSFLEKVEPGAD